MIPLRRTLKPAISTLKISSQSWPMIGVFLASDTLALLGAALAGVYLRLAFNGEYHPSLYWHLWPVIGLFLLAYWASGLYPTVGLSPVDELRRICLCTTLTYLALGAAIFLFQEGETYSRGIFLLAWLFSLIAVLAGRLIVRQLFSRYTWWGYPVLILGAGRTGELVIKTLQHQPGFGLKPLAVLDDNPNKRGELAGVPILGPLSLAPALAVEREISYAIIAMPGVQREKLMTILERYAHTFPHLLMIPDLFGIASLWVATKDLGGVLGLELRQNLLLPGPRMTKACLDVCLTVVIGLLLLPLIALIAVLIKIDSPGPILYSQERLGRGAQHFTVWKFRSMRLDADQALERYLRENPNLKENWELDHKLKDDPRITRVGKLLRRTSLDELPQLWNVLRREMSLVGPRPIVDREVWRYADKFELYARVSPGLTGLWQVSGRNDVSYDERVNLDAYYVRNWSVWLDIYILIRTVWVVLVWDGAY
ncbi:undecaprenyl-phosphate galactose phosphotransferase WbaP [Pseudanabaena sp. FACHB-2040]|nr:undecaprenyl-phosphate galactose phosphotransferase WbaP [Pseudanabaena sp. FACHB-2040]